ncbi:MAG: calcineurin-like phosphoesterase family protein [Labilithrix sp.]|nr:calcineurin-like phosphoesterase family protein [Labilithrix sp.]
MPIDPGPIRLEPRGERPEPLVFRQGAHPPFGIRWYGVTSLFGHLRNFTARAIATESVDSRDWMRPNRPEDLLAASLAVLGTPGSGETLVSALGRPVWIDFAADTGDDRDVSAAVGAMVASTYDAEDEAGDRLVLPRGDVLLFGGDIAYPVATSDEIYKRLVLPWNEQLRERRASAGRRVLLGVPGNHDWYDGLDGFGRLFRRRVDEPFRTERRDRASRISKRLRRRPGRKIGLVARQLHLDEVGILLGAAVSFFRSVRAFFTGVAVRHRRRLVLRGYVPVQEASYFALPLAPGLDLFGADRQLGRVDFRQRSYFSKWRKAHPDRAVLFTAGDPALAYGVRNEPGWRMLGACRLGLEKDRVLFLAGDFHHYERRKVGRSLHVIAGGGGAFLHGTRIGPYPAATGEPQAAYPSGAASRKLVAQVPLKLAVGRAGWLVHLALALLAAVELASARRGTGALFATSLVLSLVLGVLLYFVAHQGHGKRAIALLAAPFGLALGLLPMGLRFSTEQLPAMAGDPAVILATAFGGAAVFGLYLAMLAAMGLEHQQAFTVLGHPGFKHFVRLRVHPDGRVDGWAIGKDDMLDGSTPVLVDRWTWDPREKVSPG